MTRDTRPFTETGRGRFAVSGIATGAYPELREDWPTAIAAAALFSPAAVELTAGSERLPSLLTHLRAHPRCLDDFGYVSVHGPAAGPLTGPDIGMLVALPETVETIVVHADCCDPATVGLLASLGSRLAVENSDRMKASGQGVADLAVVFEALPEARLVLDVAHSHSNDPTGQLTEELATTFGDRLAHLHCSVLRGVSEHWTPRPEDLAWLTRAVDACPPVPRIWEQVPLFQAWPTGLLV